MRCVASSSLPTLPFLIFSHCAPEPPDSPIPHHEPQARPRPRHGADEGPASVAPGADLRARAVYLLVSSRELPILINVNTLVRWTWASRIWLWGGAGQQWSSSTGGYTAPPPEGRPHEGGGSWGSAQGQALSPAQRSTWAPPTGRHVQQADGNWGGGQGRAPSQPRNKRAPPEDPHPHQAGGNWDGRQRRTPSPRRNSWALPAVSHP